jgi:plasmid maintenance system antidote protein VapI
VHKEHTWSSADIAFKCIDAPGALVRWLQDNRRNAPMQTLADYLVENKIQQKDFAAELSVDRSIVSKLCTGKIRPGLELAFRIKRLTGGRVPFEVWIEEHDLPTDPEFWSRFFREWLFIPSQIAAYWGVPEALAAQWMAGTEFPRGRDALRAFALAPDNFRPARERAA